MPPAPAAVTAAISTTCVMSHPAPGEAPARFRADVRSILRIGAPLLVNNLSMAGMTFADTVMAGLLGPQALGSVAVGFNTFNLFLLAGLGTLMSISPLVAHAYGAGDDRRVTAYARQAPWLVLGLTALLVSGLLCVRPLLIAIHADPALIPDATGYVRAMACGLPAWLAYLALRYVSEGLGHTRPIMYFALLGLALNVALNWVFMYGKLGMPALGAVGTGVASAITMWAMFALLLAYVLRHRVYRPYAFFARLDRPDAARLREMLALGLPICGSVLSEGGLFAAASLIMSTFGAREVGAHAIAISWASLMFMVPLALHSATTIHAGHANGRGDARGGRRAGYAGMAVCTGIMAVSALVLAFANHAIAALYTRDAAVLALAAHLLLYAAVFQVVDGLQVGAAGALRGFKDARVPMLLNFGSYWLVGFPIAFGMGVLRGGGPDWVWIGLIAGLTACAIALSTRYARVARRAVAAAAPTAPRAAV